MLTTPRFFVTIKLISVALILSLTAIPALAAPRNLQLSLNAVAKDDNYNASVTLLNALNGDLSKSGYITRLNVGFGEYSYRSSTIAQGKVNVDTFSAHALIGYQSVTPAMKYRMYIGPSHLDRQLSPAEATSPSEGSRTGAMVYLQAMSSNWDNIHFSSSGYYSTAFDNYFAKVQAGWKVTDFTVGPELALLGSRSFDGQKIGIFLKGLKLGRVNMTISGGYALAADEDSDNNSPYFGVSANTQF